MRGDGEAFAGFSILLDLRRYNQPGGKVVISGLRGN